MFPEVDATPGFIGWIRSGGRGQWMQVCVGNTLCECRMRLLEHQTQAQHVERIVLPKGRHPDGRGQAESSVDSTRYELLARAEN